MFDRFSRIGATLFVFDVVLAVLWGILHEWGHLAACIVIGIVALKSKRQPIIGAIVGFLGVGFHTWQASSAADTWVGLTDSHSRKWDVVRDESVWLWGFVCVLALICVLLCIAIVIRSLLGICKSKGKKTRRHSSDSSIHARKQEVVEEPKPAPAVPAPPPPPQRAPSPEQHIHIHTHPAAPPQQPMAAPPPPPYMAGPPPPAYGVPAYGAPAYGPPPPPMYRPQSPPMYGGGRPNSPPPYGY